jgi:hypothetical protein
VDAWLTAARADLAAAAGVDLAELDLDPEAEELLLEVARVAAHESGARTNAPLLCYLVGLAQGRGKAGLEQLASAVTRSSS